ncbi:hypothetical protein [Glutamicibacter sp. NPDC127525]|uniref:hypothetical protein n=1 Tax=unclassified Glutamicibacter TaxID=2627139 RepID=UPI0036372F6C
MPELDPGARVQNETYHRQVAGPDRAKIWFVDGARGVDPIFVAPLWRYVPTVPGSASASLRFKTVVAPSAREW